MSHLLSVDLPVLKLSLTAFASWLVFQLYRFFRIRFKTTRLRGPKSTSLVFGLARSLSDGDSSICYEEWMEEYGPVYQVPAVAGSKRTVLCDPKAIAHYYSLEPWTYTHPAISKRLIENLVYMDLYFLCETAISEL